MSNEHDFKPRKDQNAKPTLPSPDLRTYLYDKVCGGFESKLKVYGPSWLGFSSDGISAQLLMKALPLAKPSLYAEPCFDDVEVYEEEMRRAKECLTYGIVGLMLNDLYRNDQYYDQLVSAYLTECPHSEDSFFGEHFRSTLNNTLELAERRNVEYKAMWEGFSKQALKEFILVKALRLRSSDLKDSQRTDALKDLCVYCICLIEKLRNTEDKYDGLLP